MDVTAPVESGPSLIRGAKEKVEMNEVKPLQMIAAAYTPGRRRR